MAGPPEDTDGEAGSWEEGLPFEEEGLFDWLFRDTNEQGEAA
jgi:hypothetical protein